MLNIRYDLFAANGAGNTRNPAEVMSSLGVRYRVAVPQSIADQWVFVDVDHVPPALPPGVTVFEKAADRLKCLTRDEQREVARERKVGAARRGRLV